MTLKVGIAGATGYLGQELVRLLLAHPSVTLAALASTTHAGRALPEVLPRFTALQDAPAFVPFEPDAFAACDVVLLATPNGVAKELAPRLLAEGARVIDLSGDHRLTEAAQATAHYGGAGAAQDAAVYGLPELNRAAIRSARLVANPGCYPTASTLAVLPLALTGLVGGRVIGSGRNARDQDGSAGFVIVDAKSGVSGAGRTPRQDLHYAEMAGSVRAYKVGAHRHEPEIAQALTASAGSPVRVAFTPHVVPMVRGILATAYVPVAGAPVTQEDVDALYAKTYADAPCVHAVAHEPDTAHVAGTNACHVRAHVVADGTLVIVTSAIDNLVKGGAGQAVQNLNLMAGLPETAGLPLVGCAS